MSGTEKADHMTLNPEHGRVLFAMHVHTPHVESLKAALRHACWLNDLHLEAMLSSEPNVVERMGNVKALISDLTEKDAFVHHDVGVAHALGLPVLCLCHGQPRNQTADLQGERIIYFGDLESAEEKSALSTTLAARLRQVLAGRVPDVIDSFRQRTLTIVRDLELLGRAEDMRRQEVWYSGFLSAFSVSEEGLEPEERSLGPDLLREKQALHDLARRGCRIVCIISPPTEPIRREKAALVRTRILCLLQFIYDNPDLPIDWVLSPYRQKNFYIIGDISCIERFQKEAALGVDLSLRQTGESAIQVNRSVYHTLVARLTQIMLGDRASTSASNRDLMRAVTMERLEHSLGFCETKEGSGE
jgi:hypothetical protein